MKQKKEPAFHYRPYDFPFGFPVFSFFGTNWTVTMTEPEFYHFHNCFEIGSCLNGAGTLCTPAYRLSFSSGDYIIVPPMEPHMMISDESPCQLEYIFFNPLLLFGHRNDLYLSVYHDYYQKSACARTFSPDSSYICCLLSDLFREIHESCCFYPDSVQALLLMLLTELHRKPAVPLTAHASEYSFPVRTALQYIFTHYRESISISQLASLCHLSESYFRKLFCEMTGISPLDYLEHYRIQQACHLLINHSGSLAQVAEMCGYRSFSSFFRQFRQYTGLSPSDWKKTYENLTIPHTVFSLSDTDNNLIFRY